MREILYYFNKLLNKEPLLLEAMTIPKTIPGEQKWKNSLLCGAPMSLVHHSWQPEKCNTNFTIEIKLLKTWEVVQR